MRHHTRRLSLLGLLGMFLMPVPSSAQSNQSPESAHAELAVIWWKPEPQITISSGSLSSNIDFVSDLGIEKTRFREFRVVLKPGRKHKLRFDYVPIRYAQDGTVLKRTVLFRGVKYDVNLPVNTVLNWDMYRFGYEWDVVSGVNGFAGVVANLQYNKLDAQLASPIGVESMKRSVPQPAIGGIARAYLTKDFSVTGEFTGFKLTRTNLRGKVYDFDVYGHVNLGRSLAAQVGYRSMKADYSVDDDAGLLKLKGIYFGAVARF